MTFFTLLLCLALLYLGLVGALASVFCALIWRVGMRQRQPAPAWLLLLRVLPATIAVGFVAGVFVPGFLASEPHDTSEPIGAPLLAGAALGAFLLAAGPVRAMGSWIAARRLQRTWLDRAEPVALAGWNGRACRVDSQFPLVTVVGLWRPRLFIARQVQESCTPRELLAIVRHEAAHANRRDNLKRLLLRAAPDALAFLPLGAALERAWSEATEEETDAGAVRASSVTGCDLAGALLKVARLASGARPAAGAARLRPVAGSALYAGGPIERRVGRLTGPAPPAAASARRWWLVWLALGLAVLALGRVPGLAGRVHQATEILVRLLA